MIERKLKGGKVLEFSGIMDFVEYCDAVPVENYSKSDDESRVEFSGGTWDDAVRQATTGNPELVKNIFDGVNIISAMIEEEKVGEIRDVTGEYFDVSDYLSGEPEVFRRDEYGERKPVVPVYASFAMRCGIGNDLIRNRGCAIVALCDELSRGGFIVDLHMVHAVEYCGVTVYCKIHVGIDPLDLDTAAFIVANSLCLRRLWFAMLEHSRNERYCGGYGCPCEYDLAEIYESGLSGFYFTSSNHNAFSRGNYGSLDNAKEHVVKMVENFKKNAAQVILG
ncbi:MAG: hypothetical protein PHI85_05120 [Victivallaceae bacterium]|nr:hypothetical protein [Victivallaceae bacterium]